MTTNRRDFLKKSLGLAGFLYFADELLAESQAVEKTLAEISRYPTQTPVYLPINGKRTLEEAIVIGTGILDDSLIDVIAEEARCEHLDLREKHPQPEGRQGKIIYSQTEIPENYMHDKVVLNPETIEAIQWPFLQLETELNIPAFQWRIYQRYNSERILLADFPVVVGCPETPTIFGEFEIFELQHFPSWSLEGKSASPGASNNPLGEWKFRYITFIDMYYHGTTEEHLLKRPSRAFSHGCVRNYNWNVSKLATLVLRNLGRLDEYDDKRHSTRTVRVEPKIRAANIYDTIEVFPDGRVIFYPDVYRYMKSRDVINVTTWEHFAKDVEQAGYSPADFDENRLKQEVERNKNISQKTEINLHDYVNQ